MHTTQTCPSNHHIQLLKRKLHGSVGHMWCLWRHGTERHILPRGDSANTPDFVDSTHNIAQPLVLPLNIGLKSVCSCHCFYIRLHIWLWSEIFCRAANIQEALATLLLQIHKDLFALPLWKWGLRFWPCSCACCADEYYIPRVSDAGVCTIGYALESKFETVYDSIEKKWTYFLSLCFFCKCSSCGLRPDSVVSAEVIEKNMAIYLRVILAIPIHRHPVWSESYPTINDCLAKCFENPKCG